MSLSEEQNSTPLRQFLEEDPSCNHQYLFNEFLLGKDDTIAVMCSKTVRWLYDSGDYDTDISDWTITLHNVEWMNFFPHRTDSVEFSTDDPGLAFIRDLRTPFEYTIYLTGPVSDPKETALALLSAFFDETTYTSSAHPGTPMSVLPNPLRARSTLLSGLAGASIPIVTGPSNVIAPYVNALTKSGCVFSIKDHNMRNVSFEELSRTSAGTVDMQQRLFTHRCSVIARRIEVSRGFNRPEDSAL